MRDFRQMPMEGALRTTHGLITLVVKFHVTRRFISVCAHA